MISLGLVRGNYMTPPSTPELFPDPEIKDKLSICDLIPCWLLTLMFFSFGLPWLSLSLIYHPFPPKHKTKTTMSSDFPVPETSVLAVASHVGTFLFPWHFGSDWQDWRLFTGELYLASSASAIIAKQIKICRKHDGYVRDAVTWLRGSCSQHCSIQYLPLPLFPKTNMPEE